MNAKIKRVHLLYLSCLLLLLPYLSAAAQTAHHASQIRGGGGPSSTAVEDSSDEGLNGRPRGHTPSAVYKTLSRRSVGRYVLATSSLVGECARIYTPTPFGVIALSLWSRFTSMLGTRGRDRRGSMGQKKHSAFSYDKFMSPESRQDDEEDPCANSTSGPDPPDKYGRVSWAFLVRHEIGDFAQTKDGPREEGNAGMSEDTAGASMLAGQVSAVDSPTDEETDVTVNRPRQPTNTAAGSVLKSLGSFGSGRRKQALDDMDLLSDSEDDDWNEWEGEGGGARIPRVQHPQAASVSVPKVKPTVGRNLVDADDGATTLVEKMRLAKKPQGGGRLRGRRKDGRSRHVNNEF